MDRDEFESSLADVSLSELGIGYEDALRRLANAGFRPAAGRSTAGLALATAAVGLVVWWSHGSAITTGAERDPAVAVVNEATCIGCMNCARACPYNAIEQREICTVDGHVCGHVAYVNPGICQGCGTCQAICLSKSVELQTFTDEQVFSEINALCFWE